MRSSRASLLSAVALCAATSAQAIPGAVPAAGVPLFVATPIVWAGDPASGLAGQAFSATAAAIDTTRLVYRDPGGALHRIAGEGLAVDFGGGDARTLQTLIDWDASEGAWRTRSVVGDAGR